MSHEILVGVFNGFPIQRGLEHNDISWSWPVDISSSVRKKTINQGARVFLMPHFWLRMISHHPCSWSAHQTLRPDKVCWRSWSFCRWYSQTCSMENRFTEPENHRNHRNHPSIFSIHHHFPIIFPSTKSLHQDSSVGGPPPNPWAQLRFRGGYNLWRIYIITTHNHPEKVQQMIEHNTLSHWKHV
jgi:hypothetical protein